jgi:acyl-CoA reductase-like NAD-dependent aldehyde dehydrogenase
VTATEETAAAELHPLNPATLEPVGRLPVTSPAGVEEAVGEARVAQADWCRRTLAQRARLLSDAVQALLDSADEIAASIVAETGKPRVEALTAELLVAAETLSWLAGTVPRALRPERLRLTQRYLAHKRAWLLYEPFGVVGIVSPWNFPFGIAFSQAATALAAGNAAVVKPSELTPHSGAWVEEVFRRAGAPPGIVRTIQGPGATIGDALVGHRGVDLVVFTGSTEVGRHVAVRAAERLAPAVLELGGKDPMLVLDDADVDRAVAGALWGSFANCGQVCSGIERIYVMEPLYEAFCERLAARAAALRLGRGEDPATELGPLITEEQASRVEALVTDAVEHGAEIVTGGARADTGLPGWFFSPTLLAGEPVGARLTEEEIFGPVVTVCKIDNETDGVRRVNASRFGLGASVWTRDRRRARRVAARLRAGSVWTNDCSYSYGTAAAPWGGRGDSGYGRTHSRHGLYALSHLKFVDADPGRLTPPWWFPYDGQVTNGLRVALDALHRDRGRVRAAAVWRGRRQVLAVARRAMRQP